MRPSTGMNYSASEREEVRDRLNFLLSGPPHSFSPSFLLAASFLVLGSSLFSHGFALWSFKILFPVCFPTYTPEIFVFSGFLCLLQPPPFVQKAPSLLLQPLPVAEKGARY